MVRKIGLAAVLVGIAAFSPAPIRGAERKYVRRPDQSQAQLAKEQQFNGVVPVVGQIPQITNEVGEQRERRGTLKLSHESGQSIAVGTANADKVGGATAIVQASNRIQAESEGGKYLWIYGVLIAATGYIAWRFVQYKVEKAMPVPDFSRRFLKEIQDGKF